MSIQNFLVPFVEDLVPMHSPRLPLAGEHVQHSEQMTQSLYIPRFCPPVGILAGLNTFPVVLYPGGWLDIVKGLTFPNKYLSGG